MKDKEITTVISVENPPLHLLRIGRLTNSNVRNNDVDGLAFVLGVREAPAAVADQERLLNFHLLFL